MGNIATYVVSGLVVVIFGSAIVGMLGGRDETNAGQPSSVSSSDPSSQESQAGSAPGLGEGVLFDSGIEIYAVTIDSSPSIPNELVIDPGGTKGQLTSVRFSLVNGSNEELSISNGSVTGRIGAAEYEPVAIFSSDGDWYVYEPVGPGLEATFDVYFDIPKGKSLTGAIFQTSLFLGDEAEFLFE